MVSKLRSSLPAVLPAAVVPSGHLSVCFQAFCLVSVAELFDKTWFVALIMAMRFPRNVVFWSCYSALVIHTLLAAMFGFVVSRALPLWMLHFIAFGLYSVFALLYIHDCYQADPGSDIIASGKEEAEEALGGGDGPSYSAADDQSVPKGWPVPNTSSSWKSYGTKVATQCFLAMFIAEWGDRTQIAMIGQHASQPLVPVCLGSLAAFWLLTGSAVMAGTLSAGKLSERTVYIFSAISFSVFALLALRDGLHTYHEAKQIVKLSL
jgi:putative Ca2+/H+ antiporter (TMEM165/GDT1 family)